jgi:hypothetical protein
MRVAFGLLAVLTTVAFMAPAAAQAAPVPHVTCGAVLTASAHLDHDLRCTGTVGVTLDGDITLDLRGHQLSGPGPASAVFAESVGVALTETGTPRLLHGTIRRWGTGAGPSVDNPGFGQVNATMSGVTFADNSEGLSGSNSTFDVAASRFLRNTNDGIGGLTTFVTARYSTFADNGRGISISGGGAITLTKSTLRGNDVGVSCGETGCAITNNSLHENGTAVAAFFATGAIKGNDFGGNDIGFTTTFDPDPGFAHELSGNTFTGNRSAVVLGDLGTARVHDNVFTKNGVGFTVPSAEPSATALLERNLFTANGNGIFVASAGTSLKQNVAVRNHRWGIYAIGAKDLGGNVAFGNGRNPQCVGVVCRTHI